MCPPRRSTVAHDFLRPQDATLFCAQDPQAPLQIGAVCLFEAGPLLDEDGRLRLDEIARHLDGRLHHVPRFRQRLQRVLFDQGPPVWVDDEHFDLSHHLHVAALPRPGNEQQLREFVARLVEQPLDEGRPLWELWFVEGVEGDRVALITKVSHVMADGMALLDFALSVLDAEPTEPAGESTPAVARPGPAAISLLVDSVRERGRRRLDLAWRSLVALGHPVRILGRTASLGRAGASRSTTALAPRLAINGAVGAHRDMAWVRLSMADLDEVKHAEAVPLNDVVLAVVTGALRTHLARSGAPVDELRPRVLVPVSTHGTTPEGEIENRFSWMVADLPVDADDRVEQLRRIHEEMTRRKDSSQTSLASHVFEVSDILPVWLLRTLAPPVLRRQPLVNLAVTDLPGTREPLFLLGAQMLELFPFISVTGNIAVIIGVLSYREQLGVGITVDADVVPDLDALAVAIEDSSAALVDAVRAAHDDRSPFSVAGSHDALLRPDAG